jgi:hypothetical protein
MFKKIVLLSFILIFSGQSQQLSQGKVIVAGWTLNLDASGNVTSMILASPKTHLRIESSIEIVIDSQRCPSRGRVKFINSVERDLNFPTETMHFWRDFGGQQALWHYSAASGRLVTFYPNDSLLPASLYGHEVRVISKSGKEYFGKIEKSLNNQDWFIVSINGSAVPFYRKAINEIQHLK